MPNRTPSRSALVAAFAAIYVIWGSTYLGIAVALESLPPFTLAAFRFLVAGGILTAWALSRGAARPTRRQFAMTALLGFLFLVIGNGGVVWAEQRVPSGLTSLLVAVTPIWTALAMWALPGGRAPSGGMIVGLVTGFLGTALLVAPGHVGGAPVDTAGAVALNLASLSWALGSVLTPRLDLPRSGPLSSGLQMLSAGVMLFLVALATGDFARFDPSTVTARSLAALLYLIVFGSLVAFSAFAWLLQVSTPARLSTTSYVNPVVAVFLGWLLAGEPVSLRTFIAGGLIVGAVAVIVTVRGRR
jgi:drug/metabolite transporter (DMT)-like permease